MGGGNIVYQLMATLGLDTKEFDDGLKRSRNEAEGGGKGIGHALGSAAKVGAAALAAATTAVVGFGASSVSAGMDFDSAMSQVAATMGYSVDDIKNNVNGAGDDFERLRNFAQQMGQTTAFSATEAADALNYMALAGYSTEQSMDMLPNVLSLAAAGNIGLAQASDMVTDAQSALGLTSEQTTDMVDQMAKASSKSNTSVSQLGEAMLTIGATARNVKGGTSELSTVLGVLADNGIKGAEGGTHLRNIIMSLQNPTKEGAAALDQLGVSVYDADGNMRSIVDIIGDLQTGLGDMDQASRDAMINGIFNKTDAAAVNALIGTSRTRFDELTVAIRNSHGAAEAMANTQLDNLAGDITLFQSALEGAKIAISDGLSPTLRDFVQFGTESISTLTQAFKEDGLQGALNALGPVIDQGISLLFDALPKAIDAGIQLLEAVITGILNNLPKLLEAGLQIVMHLVSSIQENIGNLVEAAATIITTLADGLVQMLPQLIPAIVEIVLTIVNKLTEPSTLTQLVMAAVQIIVALANGLIQAIPQLLEAVPQIISNLVGAIVANLPQILSAGVQLLVALVTGIVGAIPQLVALAPEIVMALAGGIVQGISTIIDTGRQLVDGFLKGIKDSWNGMVENVKHFFSSFIDNIKGLFGIHSPSTVFADIGRNLIAGFINGIRERVSSITDQIRSLKESISRIFQSLADAAGSWGRDLIGNFVDGLKGKLESLKNQAIAIAQQIKSVIGFSEPKEGPLSNFHTYAPDMMELFAKGIKDNASIVTNAVSDSFNLRDQIGAGFNSGTVVSMGGARSVGSGSRTQTIILQVGRTELARLVHELNGEEDERIGLKLVTT